MTEDLLALDVLDGGFRIARAPQPEFPDHLYGGRLAAQCLLTASASAPAHLAVNSIHTTFLRRADPAADIRYDAEVLRDSGSTSRRLATARQDGGIVATSSVSLRRHVLAVDELTWVTACCPGLSAPPAPETLLTRSRRIDEALGAAAPLRSRISWPIDARYIECEPWSSPANGPARIWLRGPGGRARCHDAALLVYAVDLLIGERILVAAGLSWVDLLGGDDGRAGWSSSSLDLAVWFHHRFAIDEWLLLVIDAAHSADSGGFATGHVHDCRGVRVASVAQEVVMTRRAGRPRSNAVPGVES